MQARTGLLGAATALCLCADPLVRAQQAVQTPAFRSGVELVTVDVGVADRKRLPMRGLEAGDFVVTVGGQPRRVVTAEFVDSADAPPETGSQPDVVPVSTNEGAGAGRLFVFIVDRNTIEPGTERQVVNAAAPLFARFTFADRSALMTLPGGSSVGFTWAHDRVRDALERVTGTGSMAGLEFASLTEARDIAGRNSFALSSVAVRLCSGSAISAGAGPTSGSSGTDQPPSSGSTGRGTSPAGGSQPAGGSTGGIAAASAGDRCMRELRMEAESVWSSVRATSLSSLMALRQLLIALERIRGDKTIVLISGGWPLDDYEETMLLSNVADAAAAARASIFTLFVPRRDFSVTRRVVSATPMSDQRLYSWPLETLAAMTGAASHSADVGAEGVFERLGRELSAYYRLGIEREPGDLDGKPRHLKVRVARSGATVRARELFDARAYEDVDWAARLGSALDGPLAAGGIGLRVTSYLAPDPAGGARLRLVLAGEATRVQPGAATFQVAVRDLNGNEVLAGEQPIGEPTGDRLRFSSNFAVPPGSYVVRLAVMDSAGRVGSVDHRVEARPMSFGAISATGPVLVRVPPTSRAESPHFALDVVRQDERLAIEVGLEGEGSQLDGAGVVFEIAPASGGPALVHTAGDLSRGSRDGSMLAQAVADARVLPAGQYVARVRVTRGGESLGEMRRAFLVTGAPRPPAEPVSAATSAARRGTSTAIAVRRASAPPPFRVDLVLEQPILGVFLDRVTARPETVSPEVRELLDRARSSGIRSLAVPDARDGEAAATMFLRGLTLLAQERLELAAHAFRSAMRAAPDFYPAMVYLGACYAAGGKDRDAAGAWRTALIKEGETVAVHLLLTDALLRDGRGDLALQTVEAARARWPQDEGLKRRFALAALLAGDPADGLDAVDELLAARTDDEPILAQALLVLYEAFLDGQPVESVDRDRARMIRLADAYRARGGPALALVEAWVSAVLK